MAIKLDQIIKALETHVPRKLAESWDNVGLMLGDRSQEINRVLLTLDVTQAIIAEAVEKKADLIISHHPFIFSGLKSLSSDSLKGRMIKSLIQNNISVYSAHTNLDLAETGLNDYVGRMLGLSQMKPLEVFTENFVKVVVFVPETHQAEILAALQKSGAGAIGKYDSCSFSTPGTGRFRSLEGANPFIGMINQIEVVDERRIEAIILEEALNQTINELKRAHPYETMAYDVYPLKTSIDPRHGLGRIGELLEVCEPLQWIDIVKEVLEVKILREAGKRPKKISRVALCTGAGIDLLSLAKSQKADVYITGDLKYHDGQRAEELGIWVLDAGHYDTEKFAPDCFEKILTAELEECPVLFKSQTSEGFLKFV